MLIISFLGASFIFGNNIFVIQVRNYRFGPNYHRAYLTLIIDLLQHKIIVPGYRRFVFSKFVGTGLPAIAVVLLQDRITQHSALLRKSLCGRAEYFAINIIMKDGKILKNTIIFRFCNQLFSQFIYSMTKTSN